MQSGMLIIAGSEKESAQARLSQLISHLYTPGSQTWGQGVNAIGQCLCSMRLIGSLRPVYRMPPYYISQYL